MSGSPIPRLITSMPAARLAAILRSSSANRYGGMRSRRLLDRTQLLHEIVGERSAEHRHGPARQVDAEVLPYLDFELAAVERYNHWRGPAFEHVSHGGSRRAGSTGAGLSHAALKDAGSDSSRTDRRGPGHVGPIRKQLVALDLRPDPRYGNLNE